MAKFNVTFIPNDGFCKCNSETVKHCAITTAVLCRIKYNFSLTTLYGFIKICLEFTEMPNVN